MTTSGRRALLGRLAGMGWFIRHGEVATTQALTLLLEEPLLHAATLDLIQTASGVDLGGVTKFVAEAVQEDGGRPDLEGTTDEGLPLLMVEAKFSAHVSPGQLRSYFDNQERRLTTAAGAGKPRHGVVVALVPPHRITEAERVFEELASQRRDEGLPEYSSVPAFISWDTWLDSWDEAVKDLPAGADSIAADLVQLRELCLTLGGLHMRPIPIDEPDFSWRDRADDLATLVDRVTQRLQDPDWVRILPLRREDGYDPLRYFRGGHTHPESYCSVGVASSFADQGESPLWLRYHRTTPGFPAISDLLLASDYRLQLRTDHGHLWVPLHIRPELAGKLLEEDLVRQVHEVQALLVPGA